MILLQIEGTFWRQGSCTKTKENFFKFRCLEIRNLNLFLDPLTASDPNFQKCWAATAHTAELRQSAAVCQQIEVSHGPGSPNDPFLFYKSWFPDLVVHDCKKKSKCGSKVCISEKSRLENSPWECEQRIVVSSPLQMTNEKLSGHRVKELRKQQWHVTQQSHCT